MPPSRSCLPLFHVPLSGACLEFQKFVATTVAGKAFQPKKKRVVLNRSGPQEEAIEVQHLFATDLLHCAKARQLLVLTTVPMYLGTLPPDEQLRLSAVLGPLFGLVRVMRRALRLITVSLRSHDRPGEPRVWSAFVVAQLTDGAGSLPRPCPVRERWGSEHFDVMPGAPPGRPGGAPRVFGRRADLPFHVVMSRFELLVVMYTVYALRGLPHHQHLLHDVTSAATHTRLVVRPEPRTAAEGLRLTLIDPEHDLVIIHDLLRHRLIKIVSLRYLRVLYECPMCGRTLSAVHQRRAAEDGCPRCQTTLVAALTAGMSVDVCVREDLDLG